MPTSANPSPPTDRGPGVSFPPPLLFVGGLAIGVLLDLVLPLPAVIPDARWVVILGFALVAIGMACTFAGMITFRRFRTAVYPNRPATLVVDTGVYAYTRNPMYTGLTIAYLGGVLLTGVLWVLILLPAVLTLLVTQVIRREERHLRERFPEAYAAYCARVGRWF
ncbi:methyltransferase family protein [Gemmatimonas groenlandica]|uniref:Isoprenylcysteine carboxylmethyltransferase family protein n=1 Tax=Gemmatimonas groenlandica TaxID=2732249 RepID=A0A6M4ITC2_9BACT|nr:isoprenylcysteine carboxylmethyltransferase family protein [Gemmatimonas groenlandica]QJR37465.1 isoprenylcysteine carboxylmethyltransferase family protein [Gemmatimonas groenlandica]